MTGSRAEDGIYFFKVLHHGAPRVQLEGSDDVLEIIKRYELAWIPSSLMQLRDNIIHEWEQQWSTRGNLNYPRQATTQAFNDVIRSTCLPRLEG